jgi:hypothetical protein
MVNLPGRREIRHFDQPALAARLGQAARGHVAAHSSMERSLARLWAIIDRGTADDQHLAASQKAAEAECS